MSWSTANRTLPRLVGLSWLLTMAGCAGSGSAGEIDGTWLYGSYTDGDDTVAVMVDVNAARQPYLVIEEGEMSGFSGCNDFGGEVAYNEGELRAIDVFSTLAACMPETLMDAELAFHEMISDAAAVSVSVDNDTMRWQRGGEVLTFSHSDESPPENTVPSQTSFGALDCDDDEVSTRDVPSEDTTVEEVALDADHQVADVVVEDDLGHFATGYDSEGNVLLVVAFQDIDPYPYRIYTCP